QARGYGSRAEPLLRRAMMIRREAFGERHPDFASSLGNLANALQARGSYDEAELLQRQALEIRREVLGESHPRYLANVDALAQIMAARKNGGAAVSPGRAVTPEEIGDRGGRPTASTDGSDGVGDGEISQVGVAPRKTKAPSLDVIQAALRALQE